MWELTPDDEGKRAEGTALFPVTPLRPYTVGRKDTDMLVLHDKSISRNHARVAFGPSGLTLTDTGSKFGTQVNGNRLEHNVPSELKAGDKVILGTTHFTVQHKPLVFCTSTLSSPEDKQYLANAAQQLGATVVNKWSSEVTHLIMPVVTFTPKLFSALAALKPVVTLQWLRLVLGRTSLAQPLPDVNEPSVVPALGQTVRGDVPPNAAMVQPARQALFAGRRFVCLAGGHASKNEANNTLLELTGAELQPWPLGASSDHAAKMVKQGYEFILPEGLAAQSQALSQQSQPPHDGSLPPEAMFASRAGGVVYDAAQVRLCVILTDAAKMDPVHIAVDLEQPAAEEEEPAASPVVATQQEVATAPQAMPPPPASQPPPKLPPRRLQQDAPEETHVEESEEPTQQSRAPAAGRKRKENAPPQGEAPVEEPPKRRRAAAAAAAAASPAGAEAAEAPLPWEAEAEAEAADDEPNGAAPQQSSVVETEVCAAGLGGAAPTPPRDRGPAPDGWRKRGAERLDELEAQATMAEAPAAVLQRAPRAPAEPPPSADAAAAAAAGKKGKRFVKQRLAKSLSVPIETKTTVVQSGKDEADLKRIDADKQATGHQSDDDVLDREFDQTLANNRSTAAPARKRAARR